jgi:predicted ATPase
MVLRQIKDPACRLLTLTGSGGVGKTSLAVGIIRQLQGASTLAVYFVPLAGISACGYVLPAIADTLGFKFSGVMEPKQQLLRFLDGKQVLLVLDNLEHLLDGIEVLNELLEGAPGLKVLATSREPLNLQAEWAFEVQGLPVPAVIDMNNPEANSAVALFLRRARQVKMDFTITPQDLPAIVRICQLVEGLPLGLELAATWVRTLSCKEIAAEIERSLDFLSAPRRDLPERHRSLKAVFEYSWNLLPVEERFTLRKLSAFQGGFRREAAEQIAGAALPLLSSLVGKSFIRRGPSGRYDQHELVRQYAAGRLREDGGEETSTRDRHAAYYLELLREAEPRLRGPEQQEALRELVAEIDNFRLAWAWAIPKGQYDICFRSLGSFLALFDIQGWYPEAIERLETIIRSLRSKGGAQRPYPAVMGLAVVLQGWFNFRRGDLVMARACLEEGLAVLRPSNDSIALADALVLSAPMLTSMGETAAALQNVTEGLERVRAENDPWRLVYARMMRGGTLASIGRFEEAYADSWEALRGFRPIGDTRLIAVTLNTVGFAALKLLRLQEARAFLQESLTLSAQLQDSWTTATSYAGLGLVELAEDHWLEAQAFLQKSIDIFSDLGMKGDMAFYLTYLGDAAHGAGVADDARRHWLEAARLAFEVQALPATLENIVRLAELHSTSGEIAAAFEWSAQAAIHPASWQVTRDRAARLCAELEPRLSPEAVRQARSRSRSKALQELVDEINSLPDKDTVLLNYREWAGPSGRIQPSRS